MLTAKKQEASGVPGDQARLLLVGPLVPEGGLALSASSGVFSTTTTVSAVAVSGLSVSLYTGGNPVEACLIPDGAASGASFVGTGANNSHNGTTQVTVYLYRDGIAVSSSVISYNPVTNGFIEVDIPPASIRFIDPTPTKGLHTYSIYVVAPSNVVTTTTTIQYCRLFVRELRPVGVY